MQGQQKMAETDQPDKDPVLSQVDQIVVDHEGQHDKEQVAAASAARVDAGQRQRHHHQVDGGKGQAQPPCQFAQVAARRLLDQCAAGHQLGLRRRFAQQSGASGLDTVFLEVADLER